MQNLIQHLIGSEVLLPAADMYESAGKEAPLLKEHDLYTPTAARDCLTATSARGLSTGGRLGGISTRQAAVFNTPSRRALKDLPIRYSLRHRCQSL
jgi:hypothetical protein